MASPTLGINVSLRTNKAIAGLRQMEKRFFKSAATINHSMEVVGKVTGVVAGGIGRLASGFGDVTKAALEFEKGLQEVATIASASEFPMAKIRDISLEMTKTYGTKPTEAAKSLYQAISAGATDAESALSVLHASAKLSTGGLTSLETAVDGITSSVNAYKGGINEVTAEDVGGVFFTAIKAGKTDAEQLATSIGQIAPIAAQSGVSLVELGASLATITTKGVETSAAVTQVKSLLVAMTKDASAASKAVQSKFGIDFSEKGMKAAGGMFEFLQQIRDSAGITKKDIIALTGRVEGFSAILNLTGDSAATFKATLDDMANGTENADRAFEVMTEGLGFAVDRFKGLSEVLKITIGEAVTGAAPTTGGLSAVNRAIERMTTLFSSPAGTRAMEKFFGVLLRGAAWSARALGGVYAIVRSITTGGEFEGDEITSIVSQLSAEMVGAATVHPYQRELAAKAAADEQADAEAARVEAAKQKTEAKRKKERAAARKMATKAEIKARKDETRALLAEDKAAARRLSEERKKRRERRWDKEDAADEWGVFGSFGGPKKVDGVWTGLTGEWADAWEDHRRALQQKRDEFKAIFTGMAQDLATSGIADSINAIAVAIGTGEWGSLGDTFKGVAGGILSTFGNLLIQMGSAAIVAAALGEVVPILKPFLGGSVAAAAVAGGAAIVAGGALVAAGSAMAPSGAAARPPAARSGGGGGGRLVSPAAAVAGFSGGQGGGGGPIVNNYTVNLGTAAIVGSPATVGREIERVLEASGRLRS